jgi:hypothetical protein
MMRLVQQWQEDATHEKIVERAFRHFGTQPFVYTLEPPLLGDNPVDEFMFETRQGFCEHFAASFVTLMRLAGIPARIVVGYLGGSVNPIGGHITVYQADAHAWAEVWLEDSGWVRVDPTTAIAPERIRSGIRAERLGEGVPVGFDLGDLDWIGRAVRDFGWLRDNLELQWQYWVVNFDRERQGDLLERWGLGWLQGPRLAVAAIVIGGIMATMMFGLLFWRLRHESDPMRRIHRRLRRKLRRAGVACPDWLGPAAMQQRAIAAFPGQRVRLHRIFALYMELRYSGRADHGGRRRLQQELRWLSLPRYTGSASG